MANLPYFDRVLDNTGHVSEIWKNYFLSLDAASGVESVQGTADRITIAGTAANPTVNISTSYAGQTSITTLGTVIAGTWQGTPVATGFGGTGLSAIGTAGQLLAVNGAADGLEYINPPSPLSAANPTASVGLAAVNGAASTYMRSDAAPPLDQGIIPTWTGAHIFANTVAMASTLAVTGVQTNSSRLVFDTNASGAAGAIWKSSSTGLTLEGATGSAYDFAILNPSAQAIFRNPAGTQTAEFPGAVTMASTLGVTGLLTATGGIRVTGGTGGVGRIILDGVEGIMIRGNTGSSRDFSIYSQDAGLLFSNPTGTRNLTVGHSSGSVTIPGTQAVTGAATFTTLAGSGTRLVTADASGVLGTSTAAAAGLVSGTGADNQIATWSGTSTQDGSANLTFDGSTLALTGAQTISSTLTASGDVVLTQAASVIRSDTSDASDTKTVAVAGGGAAADTRGAYALLHGNEHATFGGQLWLVAGNDGTGGLIFVTGGSLRYTLSNSGVHAFATAVSMSSTLQVTGDTILGGSGTPGRTLEITGAAGEEGIRINPADGGTPVLEFTDGSSTTAGEWWQVSKNPSTHALDFYNGSNRMSLSAAGLLSVPGAATITGTATLSSLAGSNTRVVLANTAGVVSASADLYFDTGTLALTGDMTISGYLEVGDTLYVAATSTIEGQATFEGGVHFGTGGGGGLLEYYESDSVTVSWSTGWTTTPTCTLYYSRVGDDVSIRIGAFSATSNDIGAETAAGDAPASICPASGSVHVPVWLYNNGTPEIGFLQINAAGKLTLYRGAAPSFTASGTKGIVADIGGSYSLAT